MWMAEEGGKRATGSWSHRQETPAIYTVKTWLLVNELKMIHDQGHHIKVHSQSSLSAKR